MAKEKIHPRINDVIFKDVSCDFIYKTKSILSSKETIKWEDGKEYPVITVDISSASHPFYTGQQRMLDTEGRAEKFKKRYGTRLTKK